VPIPLILFFSPNSQPTFPSLPDGTGPDVAQRTQKEQPPAHSRRGYARRPSVRLPRRSPFRRPSPRWRQAARGRRRRRPSLQGTRGRPNSAGRGRRGLGSGRRRPSTSAEGAPRPAGVAGLRHRLHPSPLCAFARAPFSAPGSAQLHRRTTSQHSN